MMRKFVLVMSLAVVCLLTFTRCDDDNDLSSTETAKFKTFNEDMRALWSDHVIWTRNVILNVMDGTPGTDEAVNRLLQNQVDIGNAIKPYYGDSAGNELTNLLTEHINTAAALLTAAKNDDTGAFNTANSAWYANADEIATFLNVANPDNFGLTEWKTMMKNHLDLTLQEAVARKTGDFVTDVATFDEVYAQILMMADMLAEGIANQFPDKF
jgi:hypothetical protein